MRRPRLLGLLVLAAFLAGCWDQRIVDQVEFILAVGMDARPEERVLVTFVTPAIESGGGMPKSRLYETEAYTPREAREALRRQSVGRLEAGKLEQIFFGEELARQGVHEYLEILKRDPFDPILSRVVVVKGRARDFLATAAKWKNKPLPGLYFKRLLDQEAALGNIPPATLDRFYVQYFAPGIDPVLPLARATPTNAVVLGSALFREDRLAGELDVDQTYLLLVLRGDGAHHIQSYPNPQFKPGRRVKRKFTLRYINAKAQRHLRLTAQGPEVAFDLSFTALLEEYQMEYPATEKDLRRLEQDAAAHIGRQLRDLWARLQAAHTDPIGIGNLVRAYHYDYWRSHDWQKVYPAIPAGFRVKVKILNSGLVR